MDLQKCYSELNGSYDDVIKRLCSEKIVKKFVCKFLDDASYSTLLSSLELGDYKQAFMAAHTLKGICQNLSFDKLFEISNAITEALRGDNPDLSLINSMLVQLKADYEMTANAIKALQDSEA